MEAVLILLLIVAIVAGIAFATDKLISWGYDRAEKKRKAEHPQLWKWMEECNEKGAEENRWYNAMVAPLKSKIDAILREWDYYSTETRVQKTEELENLRLAVEDAMEVYNEMCADTQTLRDAIHDYVEEHDLEWARHWGW